MTEKGYIEGFENGLVIVEINGKIENYQRSLFPKNLNIGDAFIKDNNKFIIDHNLTKKRRKEIQNLMNDIFD